jgi:hypothetical protein
MNFFSNLFGGIKNLAGRAVSGAGNLIGNALWSGASYIAPYLFPSFFTPSAVNARNDISRGVGRGLGYLFTGH